MCICVRMTQHDSGGIPIKSSHCSSRPGHIQSSLKTVRVPAPRAAPQIITCRCRLQQGRQSQGSVLCLTYDTAGCLRYVTKDIENNHTTSTVRSTNMRITANPQGGKIIQLPSWPHQRVLSFHLYSFHRNKYIHRNRSLQQYQMQ